MGDIVDPPKNWTAEKEHNMREALTKGHGFSVEEHQMARFVAIAYTEGLTSDQYKNLVEAVNKRPMNLTAEEGQMLRTQMVNRPDAPEIAPKELKRDEIPRWTELASAGSEFKYEPIAGLFNEKGSQLVSQSVQLDDVRIGASVKLSGLTA